MSNHPDSNPDAVVIDRLRILSAGPLAASVQQKLKRNLEWAAWPEAEGESWVFIRQVRVQGKSQRVPEQLLNQTRQLVRSVPDGENVVRFANLTELLTALLTDLSKGVARQRWYWQSWSNLFGMEKSRALASLMAEHNERLGSVCARLAQQRSLLPVWSCLNQDDAKQLAAELAWRCGVKLPSKSTIEAAIASIMHPNVANLIEIGAAEANQRGARKPLTESRSFQQGIAQRRGTTVSIPTALDSRWGPILSQFKPEDGRFQLALLLLGQEVAPLMLRQAPAELFAELSQRFAPESLNLASIQKTFQTANEANLAQNETKNADFGHTQANFANKNVGAGSGKDRAEESVNTSQPFASNHANTSTGNESFETQNEAEVLISTQNQPNFAEVAYASETQRIENSSQPLRLRSQSSDTVFGRFDTHQGGLLYLLNLLNQPQAQSLMGDFWTQLANGWAWLYRLGQELGLDETDSICSFITTQLGFDSISELNELPLLPARDELLALTHKLYGKSEVWQPSLLKLDAQIQFSPTHIDMYASMGAIRLPVRLVGLDINPGWLPWLGRVVQFHYGS